MFLVPCSLLMGSAVLALPLRASLWIMGRFPRDSATCRVSSVALLPPRTHPLWPFAVAYLTLFHEHPLSAPLPSPSFPPPHSLAVALPVFFATRSARTAIALSLASGLAEPAGVLVLLVAVHFVSPSTAGMGALLAGVAGIMAAISVLELLPQAVSHAGRAEAAAAAAAGGVVMAAVLSAIHAAGIGV